MTARNYTKIKEKLHSTHQSSLVAYLASVVVKDGRRYMLTHSERKFVEQLCKNSPLCGTFQICGHRETEIILKKILSGDINIKLSSSRKSAKVLRNQVPILADFFADTIAPCGIVSNLLIDILKCIDRTFSVEEPAKAMYSDIEDSMFDFYPNLL